eukprot:TRINITY_DN2461_c0_g1_i1.p1 TRINITY_DN2461_c0_g1~~TRINITY_DN2461_c0_g1_i1.p1  ORF type:complete len:193 (+),score=18.20 TRINITY_DN2461_c0_g1_i1:256-834(+)
MAADRGALPALVEPNQPANPLNPTPAAVGRQFDHSRKLGVRRGFRGVLDQAVANSVNEALADPDTGLAAVVNNAMAPILKNIERQQAKSHNHQSIGRRTGSLLPVSDAAGDMPTPGQFPRNVDELSHLRDGAAVVRFANHARLAYLLNFYGVSDELPGAVYASPPGALPAGAAGNAELERMQRALEDYLSEI